MTNQPNPEDNRPVYGCSGCRTSAGRSGCWKHGNPVMTVVGIPKNPEVAALQSEIAKLRERHALDWERMKARNSELEGRLLEAKNNAHMFAVDACELGKQLRAERDQQAAHLREIRAEITTEAQESAKNPHTYWRGKTTAFCQALAIIDRERSIAGKEEKK